MSKVDKTLERVLRGTADNNIGFNELCGLLRHFAFSERVRGDHHIFTRDDIREIINIQPRGATAKPYQIKQVREVFLKYQLADDTQS